MCDCASVYGWILVEYYSFILIGPICLLGILCVKSAFIYVPPMMFFVSFHQEKSLLFSNKSSMITVNSLSSGHFFNIIQFFGGHKSLSWDH